MKVCFFPLVFGHDGEFRVQPLVALECWLRRVDLCHFFLAAAPFRTMHIKVEFRLSNQRQKRAFRVRVT